MIAVIDYGMGNLRSVSKALEQLGAPARVTSDPGQIEQAEKIVLPGVGAFGAAMEELTRRRLVEPIRSALARGTPYLGICLGLQLLFEESEESPGARGLGLFQGRVKRFAFDSSLIARHPSLKVPHMGWNQVTRSPQHGCPLLQDVADGSFFYFVHSYYADPADRRLVALETDYGVRFTSMIWRDHVFATQFHPEKSQALGLRVLDNFIRL